MSGGLFVIGTTHHRAPIAVREVAGRLWGFNGCHRDAAHERLGLPTIRARVRRATAEWHTRGHGTAFQPVSAFPEPGLLEWNDDGTVMIERATATSSVSSPERSGPNRMAGVIALGVKP